MSGVVGQVEAAFETQLGAAASARRRLPERSRPSSPFDVEGSCLSWPIRTRLSSSRCVIFAVDEYHVFALSYGPFNSVTPWM